MRVANGVFTRILRTACCEENIIFTAGGGTAVQP